MGAIFGFAIGFLIKGFVVQSVGLEAYGLYIKGYVFITAISTIIAFGFPQLVLKFLPDLIGNNKGEAKDLTNRTVSYILISSLASGLLLFAFSAYIATYVFQNTAMESILQWSALYLPVILLMSIFDRLKDIVGFLNILQGCRNYKVEHLIYASSSSVYGGNSNVPFSESNSVEHPVSLYAASKKSNELMAHTYSHLFNIPTTGLRFFTVYGPWGRPDMALFLFTDAIINNKPLKVFNNGEMIRDFTFIDDIVESIVRLFKVIPSIPANRISQPVSDSISPVAPWRTVNIGGSNPIELEKFIGILEEKIGKKAKKRYLGMQQGDVENTQADISLLKDLTNFTPKTSVDKGIESFLNWYLEYNELGMQ